MDQKYVIRQSDLLIRHQKKLQAMSPWQGSHKQFSRLYENR
jgi:hypothetical protein